MNIMKKQILISLPGACIQGNESSAHQSPGLNEWALDLTLFFTLPHKRGKEREEDALSATAKFLLNAPSVDASSANSIQHVMLFVKIIMITDYQLLK